MVTFLVVVAIVVVVLAAASIRIVTRHGRAAAAGFHEHLAPSLVWAPAPAGR